MANLHVAVQNSNKAKSLDELKKIAITKDDLLSIDSQGRNPIMLASSLNDKALIRYLDDKADELLGYDVYKIFNMRDKSGLNALSIAAKNHYTDAVVILYELGAYDSFTADEDDWVVYANMQIDPMLDKNQIAKSLQIDAKRRLTEIYNKELYKVVIDSNSTQDQIKRAVKKVGDVDAKIYDENTALYHAVLHGNTSAVVLLVEQGARIDPEMIPIALDSKNEEIIAILGSHIPLSSKSISWGSLLDILLDHAVKANDAQTVEHLIPNMGMSKLREALLYSSELGSDDVLKCLLDHGVDVNTCEDTIRSRTALMLAAKAGRVSAVRILLVRGANIHTRSERGIGLTALDYAKIYARKDCIVLLRAAYAFDKYGDTPLTRAVVAGDLDSTSKYAKNADDLLIAIQIAKDTKQQKTFIKELRAQVHDKKIANRQLPFANFFKKHANK